MSVFSILHDHLMRNPPLTKMLQGVCICDVVKHRADCSIGNVGSAADLDSSTVYLSLYNQIA